MEREDSLPLNGFRFDVRHGELRDASGRRASLRPQAMAVLQCLARSPDRVVGKDELMHAVWPRVVVTDDSLVQCIKELRRALGDDEHRVVETEPRRGYRLVTQAATSARQPATSSEPPFRQQVRFATSADGVRIAYATSGNGPMTLVRATHWMTHLEWDWQSAVYGPWIQGFSQRYRHVRYDGRGCGLSDRRVPTATTLDAEVRDLEAVVDAAGLERFALLGRSQGGAIAICYAARHPERVSHLVFLGAFARGSRQRGVASTPPEVLKARWRLVEDGWGQDNAASRQLITSSLFPGASLDQMRSFNHLQRVSCTPQGVVQLSRGMSEYNAIADLTRIGCPTLVLHSPRDHNVPFEEGRLIASGISGAGLEPFDSVNHTPLPGEAAFEHVNRLIDEFLLGAAGEQRVPDRRAAHPALRSVAR